MENLKGNLNNVKEAIIIIKIRDKQGHPIHRAEFRIDDRSTLIQELHILKDKFGVDCFRIKGEAICIHNEQERLRQQEEMDALNSWREKTRGLREPDKKFQEGMRKL